MSKHQEIKNPNYEVEYGNAHPVSSVKKFILDYLDNIGFEIIDGPEVETEEFNFDMLNIKANHPARQMHDTFYVQNKKQLLRTHTSPVQIRGMLNKKPPIAFASGGKVYRKDDDSTHLPMFHQIEGIYVNEDVNFSNLKDLIYQIIRHIFNEKIELRFRPSYFPFTEPSAEVDIMSSNGEWLEVLGCGIVNPIVLENCSIDSSKYSGLAFGLGIERIAMLKHHISDIRELYKSNLDFLRQFK
jgi:phenylalanyl-tRNA synthetase alpha chain